MPGAAGSRERISSAYEVMCGQSMCSAWVTLLSRATSPCGASGSVRRMPVPAAIISSAAAIPASSEIWAFQDSAGSGARYSRE